MVIALDVDGVLADFNSTFIDLVVTTTGKDLFPKRPFSIPTWDYPDLYGYSKEEMRGVWGRIAKSEDFWMNLRPYDDTQEFLTAIYALRADVYFPTSRPGKRAKWQTENWLDWLGFPRPTVMISGDKGAICNALHVDYYIDDRNENCADVVVCSPHTTCVQLVRSWNSPVRGVQSVSTLKDFLTIIKENR